MGVATKGTEQGITKSSEPGMDHPVVYYIPTYAPAGISFSTSDRYPAWKNTSLFVGGLAGQALRRLEISGSRVTRQEVIFNQYGRVRDVVEGPDGYLYSPSTTPPVQEPHTVSSRRYLAGSSGSCQWSRRTGAPCQRSSQSCR